VKSMFMPVTCNLQTQVTLLGKHVIIKMNSR
jgi:hypothetical protein